MLTIFYRGREEGTDCHAWKALHHSELEPGEASNDDGAGYAGY